MKVFNIYEAKTKLSQLIEETLKGNEVIIARSGEPLVVLVPYIHPKKKRKFGALRGKIKISEDFDGPLPEDVLKTFEE